MSDLPVKGSKWVADDGCHVIVEDVVSVQKNAWSVRHKIFVRVLNATGRMRKQTVIDSEEFGENGYAFLRPAVGGEFDA